MHVHLIGVHVLRGVVEQTCTLIGKCRYNDERQCKWQFLVSPSDKTAIPNLLLCIYVTEIWQNATKTKNWLQCAYPHFYTDPKLVTLVTTLPVDVLIINRSRIHYSDVIMGAISSHITSLAIFYSTVYSDADQRKHQSSASLAFVWGINRGPVNSPHKGPVTREMFPFDDVIMITASSVMTERPDLFPC